MKGLKTAALSCLGLVNPDRLRITTPTQPNSTPFAESHPTPANHVLQLLLWTRRCSTGGKSSGNQSGFRGPDPGHFMSLKTRHTSSSLCSSRSPPSAFLNVDFTKLEFGCFFLSAVGPGPRTPARPMVRAPQTIVEPTAFTCAVSSTGITLPLPSCQAYSS